MLAMGVPVEGTGHGEREVARERGLGHRRLVDDDGQGSDPLSTALYPSFGCLRRVERTDSRGVVALRGDLNTERAAVKRDNPTDGFSVGDHFQPSFVGESGKGLIYLQVNPR